MAEYIRATADEDDVQRRKVIEAIVDYNREDLEATWAVLEWLRAKFA